MRDDTQYVFISHSSLDKPALKPLLDALLAADIKVWIDQPGNLAGYTPEEIDRYFRRIHAGKPWQDSIDTALDQCALVVGVWSPKVVDAFGPTSSGVLRKELQTARNAKKLACCRIDAISAYPDNFGNEEIADITTPDRIKLFVNSVKTNLRAAFFTAYRQNRMSEWALPRYGASDELFTNLSVLIDKGADEIERWDRKKQTYEKLPLAIDANPEHQTFVLLGSPGSGKSTLLRKLDLDTAKSAGSNPDAPFSWFVSLKDYRNPAGRTPLEWLQAKWDKDWRKENQHVESLEKLLAKEGSFLLLDALNEMPRSDAKSYDSLVDDWRDFIADVRDLGWKCRIIFSCRSLLYSNRLSTPEMMVPHIDILPLDAKTIKEFLQHYAKDTAAGLFRQIETSNQLELYSTAYFLKMLVEVSGGSGEIPGDRAELLTAYVRGFLIREYLKTDQFRAEGVLTGAEVERLGHLSNNPGGWRDYELLEEGPLFLRLADLAYEMQSSREGELDADEHFQLVVQTKDARAVLADTPQSADKLLEAACQLSILDHDKGKQEVQFGHQLLQEYFAGRRLAKAPDASLVALPWRVSEVTDKQPDNINEPLPPADSTGWEETTLFAVLMCENPDAFIGSLVDANLPLAGRAAAKVAARDAVRRARKKSGSGSKNAGPKALPQATITRIQDLLLERMVDQGADFRVRVALGNALGDIGHPDLSETSDSEGRAYILPQTLAVEPLTHRIGYEKSPHTFERGEHDVALKGFEIAVFPVTNGEWARFMRDGGYENEDFWPTRAAKDWRRGDTTFVCRTVQWYAFRQMLQDSLKNDQGEDYLSRKLASKELSPKEAKNHEEALKSTDEQFAAKMKTDFGGGRHIEPRRWRDRNFSNPLQPVVGICWYEAVAYAAWLSERSGQRWRLPTEAEWEAAARRHGAGSPLYPWGEEFSTARCNTFESHIRSTTPVGLYASQRHEAGDDAERELADLSGNAFEWTLSRYDQEKFTYPYRPDDGREEMEDDKLRDDEKAEAMSRRMLPDVQDHAAKSGWDAAKVAEVVNAAKFYPRVLRGGSFYYSKDEARLSFRLRFHPGYHNQSTGFRLVREV